MILFAAVLLVGASHKQGAALNAGENVLSNGGFEKGDLSEDACNAMGKLPWLTSAKGGNTIGVSNEKVRSGSNSLAWKPIGWNAKDDGTIEDASTYIVTAVQQPVASGATSLRVNGFVNTSELDDSFSIRVILANGTFSNVNLDTVLPGARAEWQAFDVSLPLEKGDQFVITAFGAVGTKGVGAPGSAVYVDDLSMHFVGQETEDAKETVKSLEPEKTAWKAPEQDNHTRPFHMGFTTWPYGASDEARHETYAMVKQHGDLMGFHLDNGIPWPEALAGTAYHPNFERELDAMLKEKQDGKAVYLGFAPLNNDRDGVASYHGQSGGMPLPPPWDTYGFGDQEIIDAYSHYCIDMIGRFEPHYVNIGIEVLEGLAKKKPEQWPDFARFIEAVYGNIKAVHPEVPIGISMGVFEPGTHDYDIVAKAFEDIRPFMDYVGISTYPYSGPPWGPGDGNPNHLAGDWLSKIRTLVDDMPIAITETGFIGEDIKVPLLNWDIHGSPQWQDDYVTRLLSDARRLDALFVVWWAVADFDKLYETFSGWAADVAAIWRDTGLYDGKLQPRPGLTTWDKWLAYKRLPAEDKRRPFHMGFTPFPWDMTQEAVDTTYEGILGLGDLIAHHMEGGVPWAEMLEDGPLPKSQQDDWNSRKAKTPLDFKVYVALNCLDMSRKGLALNRGEKEDMPLPEAFENKHLSDPMVKTAYLNYCRRAIRHFDPDYFGIGIEVNELTYNNPEEWPHFVELYRHVYWELKKEYPHLPLFATMTLHSLIKEEVKDLQIDNIKAWLPLNDIAAISFYSFINSLGPAERPREAFAWLREFVGDKPIAISESTFPAEPTPLENENVVLQGSPEDQAAYIETLLEAAKNDEYLFVVLFLYRDYDQLWERIKGGFPSWAASWRDSGMLDGEGNARPALDVWKRYLSMRPQQLTR
jgi:hypothetical protein